MQVRLQLSYHPTSSHAQPYRAPAPAPPPSPPAAAEAASPSASPGPRAAPVAAPPVLGALAVLLQSTTLPSVKLAAPAALLQLGMQKHHAQLPAPSSGRCDWNFRCAFALQAGFLPLILGCSQTQQDKGVLIKRRAFAFR